MTIETNIRCANTPNRAVVGYQGDVIVSDLPYPPLMPQKVKIFRQYFTDDGTIDGSEDMRTATNKIYYIKADKHDDRYITKVSFLIEDAGAVLNKFGNITALTNGCEFYYETASTDQKVVIHESLKSNWDFIRMSCLNPAFGDSTTAFRLTNVVSTAEAFAPVMDFREIMPECGIKLDKGTNQRLIISIKDDTTGVDGFNAIAYGFDRFE